MGRVKSLQLERGTRIGNYEIVKHLGRGWEGEVYEVKEVPTQAVRAMKIFQMKKGFSVRDIVHKAWFFDQLADTGAVAKYYHMGQWFLTDDEGIYYLLFEKLEGDILKQSIADKKKTENKQWRVNLLLSICESISKIHEEGYAIGDFCEGDNIMLLESNGKPVFFDCDTGKADKPNQDYLNDLKEELWPLFKKIFESNEEDPTFKSIEKLFREYSKENNSKNIILKGFAPKLKRLLLKR